MHLRRHLRHTLAMGLLFVMYALTSANVLRDDNGALSSLYDSLLHREYAGPIVFPNLRVERKAQRSPSLRLRFGRRADPNMLPPSLEKRWFGDVNQKPIRSPSLRLRFGRRNDPTMPLHSNFDLLMNARENANDDFNENFDDFYERVLRKPQRLRWGRNDLDEALPNFNDTTNVAQMVAADDEDHVDSVNPSLESRKLSNLLWALQRFETATEAPVSVEDDLSEFERSIRKQTPLRLRWGRSTDSIGNTGSPDGTDNESAISENDTQREKSRERRVEASNREGAENQSELGPKN